jgi:hypothetical protein
LGGAKKTLYKRIVQPENWGESEREREREREGGEGRGWGGREMTTRDVKKMVR